MKENKGFKYFSKCLILCISLFMFTLPIFAEGKASTFDEAIGIYTGTLMRGETGTLVEATVEKTSASTGFVTISGVEGRSEAQSFFMTFDSSNANFLLYPDTVNLNTPDLENLPFVMIGIFVDGGMFGEHALYNRDETMPYPTDSICLHKVILPKVTLTEDEINTSSLAPFKIIDSEFGETRLKDSKVEFYEYESGFSSMKISFAADTATSSYSYMITLPKEISVHLVSKSPVSVSPPSFDDQFGRFVASRISSDLYGPWNYVDPITAGQLQKTYEGAILNQLNEESDLGKQYFHYNSYAGVLTGKANYELEIVFNGNLESFFTALNDKPAALYVGGAKGELLIDGFKLFGNLSNFESLVNGSNEAGFRLENNCLINATLDDTKVQDFFGNHVYESLSNQEEIVIDKEAMTLNGINKIVSLAKNKLQTIVTLENPEDEKNKFYAVFDKEGQLEFFMTYIDEHIVLEIVFEHKIGFIELSSQTDKGVYNEFIIGDYTRSEELDKMLETAELILQRSILIKK